ncbi:gliding motility-associated C-terminal domain-containing protein [Chitinophagaceae bacterium 26-R-25]|nr:gliding motility-associated C-terminal domain-containing protein [Chitinophagaceae bacterium 26-R-25]
MKTIILLLLALSSVCPVFANTFTVTSNADSGPGTLREAITLANANGTSVADVIDFNIADVTEAGRTITLLTELPVLSSNITIDGSNQSGTLLGMSSARVTLFLNHHPPTSFTYLFIQNASNVKIYGLYFKFFDDPNTGGNDHYAIGLRNSSNVTIGAPGKGNLFFNVRASIANRYWNYSSDAVNDVTIQSNVFGFSSSNGYGKGGFIQLDKAANITFGGPNVNEGNICLDMGITLSESTNPQFAFFFKMQNNRFNLDPNGNYLTFAGLSIMLYGATGDMNTVRTWIQDNILASTGTGDGISLQNVPHKIIVTGNKFGVNASGTVCYGGSALGFYNCKNAVVGGYTAAEQNIFGGYIYSQTHGVHFIQNTISSLQINGETPADPYVRIISYDNGLITGVSQPNSKIQLYSVSCPGPCKEYSYYSTIFADASGNWSYPYTASMPTLAATATTPDSSTSEFSTPIVDYYTNRVIKNATCGKSNGSITGMKIIEGTHIVWKDYFTSKVISTDTNLIDAPAGHYVYLVSNGANGCQWRIDLSIEDISPPPSLSVYLQDATCGKTNGYINTNSSSSYSYKWTNANGDSVGTNYYINQLPAGTYYVTAYMPNDRSCNKTYGPYTIKNLSGPTLNMAPQINAATCSQANGSITGITATNATGSIFRQWIDSLNRPVGNNYDLLNLKSGKYRFKFKDQGSCDTIISPWYVVPDNGAITVDQSKQLIEASNCNASTGSVKQLQITNGETYQWTNTATNQVVGGSPDVYNLAAGSYQLKISNATGCSQSIAVAVPAAAFKNIGVASSSLKNAFCNQNNGSVTVNSFDQDQKLYSFRWVNQNTGAIVGTGTSLANISDGSYHLVATDDKGCERDIFVGQVGRTPFPVFNYSAAKIKNDQCQFDEGSITGIQIENLVSPTTYTWYDQNTHVVGNTPALQQVGAGVYTLKITDGGICTTESKPFTLINQDITLRAPSYDNITIPRNTDANLQIRNASAGTYRLFTDAAGTDLLSENTTGNFTVNHVTADANFYVQYITGTCSSEPTPVKITVVDKSFFSIPNAFSPNGDGNNDRLTLRVTGRINVDFFRVFNRFGQLVFETNQVNDSWDGSVKGQLQSSGTYVWIAQGKDLLGKVIQAKGSFVLIR